MRGKQEQSIEIGQFESIRPPFETRQEETLNWLVEAHTTAERPFEPDRFREEMRTQVARVCPKPDQIAWRGHVVADYLHTQWDEMEVYRLHDSSKGVDLTKRTEAYEIHVDRIFERLYPPQSNAPDHLIHITCTGYVAPSGAQKIVSKRKWNTSITHAYHMGCYASLPSLRVAQGLALLDRKSHIDLVHTEICSLHTHPHLHAPDQLIAQGLFADGFIRYRVGFDLMGPKFQVHQMEEAIIPDTDEEMTWTLSDTGFFLSLSKHIPIRIARALPSFLERFPVDLNRALFAIHPGGPKILNQIGDLLNLQEDQLTHSRSVLKNFGNMSSATLPHIWMSMLQDVEMGRPIISLAFGPGLTLFGSWMERVS